MSNYEFDDFADVEESNPQLPHRPSDDTALSRDTLSQPAHKRRLEDLTLAELLGQFMRKPVQTWSALNKLASQQQTPPTVETPVSELDTTATIETTAHLSLETPTDHTSHTDITPEQREQFREARSQFIKLGLYVVAFGLAVWGSIILVSAEIRYEAGQLDKGAPFLLAGFLMWLFAEFSDELRPNKRFNFFNFLNRSANRRSTDETIPNPERLKETLIASPFANTWVMHPVRIFAGIGAVFFSAVAWFGNPQNQFTGIGFWGWMVAIMCTVILFAPKSWSPNKLYANFGTWLKTIKWFTPSVGVMLIILVVGTVFRFHDLSRVPPEMTSDHIEKLLNVYQILNGDRSIFFTNNGGRESFHMYVLALFSQLTGLELGFTLLKVVAIIESIITLPFLWWLGREIIGEKNRKLGNAVGLGLAALVAVSYWHVAITRLSLRIVLTPLVAALLLGFLIRALRHNQRGDFIMAGLVLGWGLYTYQAVRMMPVFIILAVGWAMWCRLRQRGQWRLYLGHLAILIVVAFVVFIPLFRFSVEYPNLFWMRTQGRLFGDDVIQTVDENGVVRERIATLTERLEAFNKNLPILSDNIRNALLMYNWKSDIAWISAYPNYPAMDTITGSLLIVGLGALLGYMILRKDGLLLIVPLMVVIMLLPSALSIAQPLENPSATRTSGSLPAVYLIAALPIGLFVLQMERVFKRMGERIAVGIVAVLILMALSLNSQTYFDKYYQSYIPQSLPHSEAGRILRGFATSDGSYGNAFLISYANWFDDRIVGLIGGNMEWEATHGIDVTFLYVPNVVSDAYYCPNRKIRLDVDRDLLFFYHFRDDAMEANLRVWFPNGRTTIINSYQPNDDFKIYRVPALGEAGFRAFARQFTANPACPVP